MENSVFHCLGSKGKQRGWKIRKKIFLPDPTIFFLPNREENCGEKAALNMKLHKCPLPPTLLTNTTAVLESSKKKTRDRELEKKKERKHFLNEGEKERKEGGDKEIKKNVYGGRKKKKKPERVSWRR